MGSDTIDMANDAASGDFEAWKILVGAFSVIALVAGTAVGLFYTVGRNIGSTALETASGAAENVTDGGSSGGSGGGSILGGDD